MKTLTLRNVPDELSESLALAAQQAGQSINATAVKALSQSFGLGQSPRKKRDLSALAGTWNKKDEAAFRKATAVFDKIDKDLWRS